MYARLGSLPDASAAFREIENPNVYSWNILLAAHDARSGHVDEAFSIFNLMPVRNVVSWNSLINICSSLGWYHCVKWMFMQMPQWSPVTVTEAICADAEMRHLRNAKFLFDSMPNRCLVSWNAIIQGYLECDEVELATSIFAKIPAGDGITWNSMILWLAQNGHMDKALEMFMAISDDPSFSLAWTTIIAALGNRNRVKEAQELFDRMLGRSIFPWNAILTAYLRQGEVIRAREIFALMPQHSSSTWYAMLQGLAEDRFEEALDLFESLPEQDVIASNLVLGGIVNRVPLDASVEFFELSIRHRNVVSWNLILKAHSGAAMADFFRKMPCWDISSWNVVIASSISAQFAEEMFWKMPQRDLISWTTGLTAISEDRAMELFEKMPQYDAVSWNAIIHLCSKQNVEYSRSLFERMPERDHSSWTNLTVANAESGAFAEARIVLHLAPCHNIVSTNAVISLAVSLKQLDCTFELHSKMTHRDIITWIAIVSAYAESGQIFEAQRNFDLMPQWDLVSWNSMISIYADNDMQQDAKLLFDQMREHDVISWTSLMCSSSFPSFEEIFAKMPEYSIVSWNALLTCYSRDPSMIEAAKTTFDQIPHRDPSSWNALAMAYARTGHLSESKEMLDKMPLQSMPSWTALLAAHVDNGEPDVAVDLFLREFDLRGNLEALGAVSWLVLVDACSSSARLGLGREIHGEIERRGLADSKAALLNAVVHMYGKCGRLDLAHAAFESIDRKGLVSWNTMITALARHGRDFQALELFLAMNLEGVMPDVVTFIAVLAALSHRGLPAAAVELAAAMEPDFHVAATSDHHVCLVDALGRAGLRNTICFSQSSHNGNGRQAGWIERQQV